jgi:hypothetical protein
MMLEGTVDTLAAIFLAVFGVPALFLVIAYVFHEIF